MITFRTEEIIGEATESTEVEVVFEDKDSASALYAKHRVVDVICEMLIPEGELTQSRPTPLGAE